MLNNAFHRVNFPLLALICESFKTYNLAVNKVFLARIEKFLLDTRTKVLAMVCPIRELSFSFMLSLKLLLFRNVLMSILINIVC